jgi:hypothetical protein
LSKTTIKLPEKFAKKLRVYKPVKRVGLEGGLSIMGIILGYVRWEENDTMTITGLNQRIKKKSANCWILS